jgi:ribosomal protein S18 acetylase RimI-like enzyme
MRVVISRLSADLGVGFVTLEVRCDDERAVRLFERLRFEVVETKRGAIEFDGELVDAYGMLLDLNALRPSI